jgi:hypothetical protein
VAGQGGRSRAGLVLAKALALAGWLSAPDVHAFCRTRLCEFPDYDMPCEWDPETGCSVSTPVVFWSNRCMPFAVQRDGSVDERISASELEALVEDGFRTWSELSCGVGVSPPLAAASQGPIACGAAEYNCEEPEANSNLVTFRDDFQDTETFHAGVIALTTATARFSTGELLDADIQINSRDEDFVLDGSTELRALRSTDLRAVVNHELGHLLGLSHSRVPGALMLDSYAEGRVEPSEDDRRGICEALGSGADDPLCEAVELGSETGCLGANTGCRRTVPADAEPGGCDCRVAGAPVSQGGVGWSWLVPALAAGLSRRSCRRSRG